MFDRASGRYDLLNSLLSLGLDRGWRAQLGLGLRPGDRILDLCCGSARSVEIAYRASQEPVVGVDASPHMLREGAIYSESRSVPFVPVQGDGLHLPFHDQSFDAVTIAWGLRNLSPEREALREVIRVLRPGGVVHILDSPSPEPGWMGSMHRLYLRGVVPTLGRLSPDPAAYRYLSESILRFGRIQEVAKRLRSAGLSIEEARSLFFGAAGLWRARRPRPESTSEESASRPTSTMQSATPNLTESV